MMRILLFLLSITCLMISCTSTKEENLINIGRMIINSEIESMQYDDSIRKAHCEGEITPAYVLITERNRYDGLELYSAFISEYGENVDVTAGYKNRIIAICYAKGDRTIKIPSDSCGYMSFDEREWYILYDTKTNKYVAVRSILNISPENILQLNQRNWDDEIQVATLDTSVPVFIQQEGLINSQIDNVSIQ